MTPHFHSSTHLEVQNPERHCEACPYGHWPSSYYLLSDESLFQRFLHFLHLFAHSVKSASSFKLDSFDRGVRMG